MKFSKQDVKDAWSASVTQATAEANNENPEVLAGTSYSGKMDTAAADFALNPDDLDSPIIEVFAGHIATSEAVRQVGLKAK